MKEFVSDRQALDYLAGRIAAEAARENVPLSEVERKMLYFSETDWTLPDMAEVSAEFAERYDDDEYEQKIAGLIRKIRSHSHGNNQDEKATWNAAVKELGDGDHYLQVMLSPGFSTSEQAGRPPHDILKLWLTAFGIVFGALGLAALDNWLNGPKFSAAAGWIFGDRSRFGLFVVIFVVIVAYFGPRLRDVLSVFLKRK